MSVVTSGYFRLFMVATGLTLCNTVTASDATEEKIAFENNVGKGENAGYQHFLLFPLCFLLC